MNIALSNRSLLRSPAFLVVAALVILYFLIGADPAHAADSTGGGGAGLPWEGPLATLRKSVSGPVAFAVALLGIIGCGGTLIWGGEVSEFARRMIFLVLVICILVFANTMLTGALFSGAMVPTADLRAAYDALAPIRNAIR